MPMTDMQKLMAMMAAQQFGGLLQQHSGMQPRQQINPMALLQYQQQQGAQKKQEEAQGLLQSKMAGGVDPSTGINWNPQEGFMGSPEHQSLVLGAYPDEAGRMAAQQAFVQPKEPTPPSGYQFGEDDTLSFIPGGPADPAQVGALAQAKPDRSNTERDKLRMDLQAKGHSEQDISEFFINRDRYQFSKDMFGQTTIFDRYTGQPVGGSETPSPEGRLDAAAPPPSEAQPSAAAGYEQATGASGFFGGIANTISDAMGLGLAAPETEKATSALKTLQNRTELFLTASVPGRESNQVRERLRELTVTPGSLRQGDERAKIRLTQTRDFIGGEMSRLNTVLENPEGYKASDLAAARENLEQLSGLHRTYDDILRSFRAGGEETGEMPSVSNADEYRSLPSGTLYVDPTGTVRRKK